VNSGKERREEKRDGKRNKTWRERKKKTEMIETEVVVTHDVVPLGRYVNATQATLHLHLVVFSDFISSRVFHSPSLQHHRRAEEQQTRHGEALPIVASHSTSKNRAEIQELTHQSLGRCSTHGL
jgi:hypothetical protein